MSPLLPMTAVGEDHYRIEFAVATRGHLEAGDGIVAR
jgi:hypothetical protein